MNGAMAELWVKISSPPNKTNTTIMGIIHHNFRSQRNSTNSAKIPTRSLTRFSHDISFSSGSCPLLYSTVVLFANVRLHEFYCFCQVGDDLSRRPLKGRTNSPHCVFSSANLGTDELRVTGAYYDRRKSIPSPSRVRMHTRRVGKNLLSGHCAPGTSHLKTTPALALKIHSEGEGIMRSGVVCAVLAGLCLAYSPVLAELHVNVETPGEEQVDVSGISQIRGWAYSTLGGAVTVILRVNGINLTDTVPCCSPRADVKGNDPQIPLNTGFSAQINYGLFNPAVLTSIGVQVTAPGEPAPAIIDRPVTAIKPGNAEFITNFALGAGANAAVDGDEIVVGGAQVTFEGGSAKTNLRLKYETGLQSPTIIEKFDGTNAALFDPVQAIFTNRCIQCHSGQFAPLGLDLSAGNAWKNIVARGSVEDPSRPRVNPGDDERSYLYQKVIPMGDISGVRMPFGCS